MHPLLHIFNILQMSNDHDSITQSHSSASNKNNHPLVGSGSPNLCSLTLENKSVLKEYKEAYGHARARVKNKKKKKRESSIHENGKALKR